MHPRLWQLHTVLTTPTCIDVHPNPITQLQRAHLAAAALLSPPRQPQAERLAALAYNNTACAVHVLLDAAVQRKQNQTRLSQLSPAVKAVLQPAGVRIVLYDSARAEYDGGRWDVRRAWQGMTGASSQALARFAARGDYNHSWLIEDDVFFTGHPEALGVNLLSAAEPATASSSSARSISCLWTGRSLTLCFVNNNTASGHSSAT